MTLVCWGGTKGPAIESLKLLHKAGVKANVLHLVYIWPFPKVKLEQMLEQCKHTIMVEANHLGQFEGLMREFLLKGCDARIHKIDGRPFNPIQMYRDTMKIVKANFTDVMSIATDSYATQELKA